ADLVRAERWGEALAAFERAAEKKPHAITTFNIAQCERAMGQYTRARRDFVRAIDQDENANGEQLPESSRVEARGLASEMDRILARASVRLEPAEAAIAVDGRPLDKDGESFVAGTLPPGPGASPQLGSFVVVLNPGAHVFTVSRQGYQDVVLNRTFAPAATEKIDLLLDRLPATIHLTSNLTDAIVKVNDADVGNPPVEVSRNAGRYRVTVARKGWVTYETDVAMRPGERIEIAATMHEEKRALTQTWWFWTAVGVVVVGAAAGTYALTRSDSTPQRPPTDGGGLGWSLKVP
ncbi:MAG TPA: PEGA domain-containing protein, partial [Labilithrix sp.]